MIDGRLLSLPFESKKRASKALTLAIDECPELKKPVDKNTSSVSFSLWGMTKKETNHLLRGTKPWQTLATM